MSSSPPDRVQVALPSTGPTPSGSREGAYTSPLRDRIELPTRPAPLPERPPRVEVEADPSLDLPVVAAAHAAPGLNERTEKAEALDVVLRALGAAVDLTQGHGARLAVAQRLLDTVEGRAGALVRGLDVTREGCVPWDPVHVRLDALPEAEQRGALNLLVRDLAARATEHAEDTLAGPALDVFHGRVGTALRRLGL
jgi:hypothetical protein